MTTTAATTATKIRSTAQTGRARLADRRKRSAAMEGAFLNSGAATPTTTAEMDPMRRRSKSTWVVI